VPKVKPAEEPTQVTGATLKGTPAQPEAIPREGI